MSTTIVVPDSDILIQDSIEASRDRIREASEKGLVTPNEPWHITSFTVDAIYKGPEVIQDTNLASIRHEIPERLNLEPHLCNVLRIVTCALLTAPITLIIVGTVDSTVEVHPLVPEVAEEAHQRAKIELGIGIPLMVVGTICMISSCIFGSRSQSKEKQYRREVVAQLTPQLLADAKRIAEARIQAAKEARQLHVV